MTENALHIGSRRAQSLFDRGQAQLEAGELEAATALLTEALTHDGENWRIHEALGHVLERRALPEQAADAARRALQRAPGNAFLHHQLGRRLGKIGAFDAAVEAHSRAIALHGNIARFHIGLSVALGDLRRDSEAVQVARAAADRFPDQDDVQAQLARSLAEAGHFQTADAVCDTVFQLDLKALGLPETDTPGAMAMAVVRMLTSAGAQPAGQRRRHYRVLAWLSACDLASDLVRALSDPDAADPAKRWPLPDGPAPVTTKPAIRDLAAQDDGPLLSVMLPVYDPAEPAWLKAAIESVLVQDQGPDWAEIVVLDDFSPTDAAREIVQGFGGRVVYRRNSGNLGLVRNHNACLSQARGAFVHILHQDDRVEPGFYDALLKPLVADQALLAGFSGVGMTGAQDQLTFVEPLERPEPGIAHDLARRLIHRQRIQFASVLVRREAYPKAGGFSPDHPYCFDWEMWLRLANRGPVWYEPRPLATHRLHGKSATHGIDLASRLVDILRTQFRGVEPQDPNDRPAIARTAFFQSLVEFWPRLHTAHGQALADLTAQDRHLARGNPLSALLSAEPSRTP